MKKEKKGYAVNNQEDEDGYTLYPENAVNYKTEKKKQDINTPDTKAKRESDFVQMQFHGYTLSASEMQSRIK
jgi:hypothetical protein